jgi:beta-mannosidase
MYSMASQSQIVSMLSSGWTVKKTGDDSDEEIPVHIVPTDVHVDLLRSGRIRDPFVDLNELAVRWVGECSWTYTKRFETPKSTSLSPGSEAGTIDLVFKGLDTFATVYLNGRLILESENMFVEHRVKVDQVLHSGTTGQLNTLTIVFDSARHRGLETVAAHPDHRFIVHQTEVSRGPVRKAQYHWGWDWGPILMTCGPWKPVLLDQYSARIRHTSVHYALSADLSRVELVISVYAVGELALSAEVELALGDEPAKRMLLDCFEEDQREIGQRIFRGKMDIDGPQLWWPYLYGPQALYDLHIRLMTSDKKTTLASQHKKIGFRRAELVQETDTLGQSFYFRINNIDVFAAGSCWIPGDSFLSRMTKERYLDWIKLVREGNQSMIRVWGGGIYESDSFYDACDELGVLVWQDFAFACANYPAFPAFLSSVETEARQNIRRLHHHPSLVIWAGNNEDYQIAERYGLQYDFDGDKDPQSWLRTDFPARYLYEHLLPLVTEQESPGTIYHSGSPWGNGKSTTLKVDPTVGDVHQWNVWHGEMKPLQNLPAMGGRFVSEFGMEAYPHVETLKACVSEPTQRYPGSMPMDFHNKAVGHERRLVSYVSENFRLREDLGDFAHLTQVLQADAMSWAYKSWRRDWGQQTPARKCGGVLVWQLNDCWPTISWSVVDYFSVKKPAFYAIRRALQPLAIGVAREFHDWTTRPADKLWQRDTGHVDPTKALGDVRFSVWVVSSVTTELRGVAQVRFVSIATGEEVAETLKFPIDIRPNGTTDVFPLPISVSVNGVTAGQESSKAEPFVIHASLWVDGEQISSDTSWPDPIKYLDLSDRGIEVSYADDSCVRVSARKPVKGFVFSEKRGVKLSDNGFDIIPGDAAKVVQVRGASSQELGWSFVH